jgi:hypothetical protein
MEFFLRAIAGLVLLGAAAASVYAGTTHESGAIGFYILGGVLAIGGLLFWGLGIVVLAILENIDDFF